MKLLKRFPWTGQRQLAEHVASSVVAKLEESFAAAARLFLSLLGLSSRRAMIPHLEHDASGMP
jgi:hypothetical protein